MRLNHNIERCFFVGLKSFDFMKVMEKRIAYVELDFCDMHRCLNLTLIVVNTSGEMVYLYNKS